MGRSPQVDMGRSSRDADLRWVVMEKRQRLAMLVILTKFVRWLEQQGALRTASSIETDKLVQRYVRGVNSAQEARQTPPGTD